MLGLITGTVTQIAHTAGSVVGWRRGIEEPQYRTVERLPSGVEIRHYGPRVAAETVVDDSEEAARNTGFRRLAGYIFGGNHVDSGRSGEKIAMTAPVAQRSAGEGRWLVRFYMPHDRTRESLPLPDSGTVVLTSLPEETVAVTRFSGSRSPGAIAAHTESLLTAVRNREIQTTGEPSAWFYDPPWTLPMLRRNEIAVPVNI
jgi:hypothetical protein